MDTDDITLHFSRLHAGDPEAIERVWRDYFEKLVRFARGRLPAGSRRIADEEDVALSAMHSFCRLAAERRLYDGVRDRDALWRLLVRFTARKAARQRRRGTALKRGAGEVRGESVFARPGGDDLDAGIEEVLGREPTPEFAEEVAEDCNRLLAELDDDVLRRIAILKLEGYLNQEIAEQLGCVTRSVERKLERIRSKWSRRDSDLG